MFKVKENFWCFMDSAKGFWTLIVALVVAGIGYMSGSKVLIDWYMRKRKGGNDAD
jgi:hypothetical protein